MLLAAGRQSRLQGQLQNTVRTQMELTERITFDMSRAWTSASARLEVGLRRERSIHLGLIYRVKRLRDPYTPRTNGHFF